MSNSYEKEPLYVEDLQRAEAAIIEFCQSMSFMDEINALKKGSVVKRSIHLHKLIQDNLDIVEGVTHSPREKLNSWCKFCHSEGHLKMEK